VKIRILGCGTSSGVPRIGGPDGRGDWGNCDPAEPRNRRTRASIIVETETTRILVDTSPDMREQLLAAAVDEVDAVIWTHDHADHCNGIDDLRQLYQKRNRPVRGLALEATGRGLRARFGYAFDGKDGYPPSVALGVLQPTQMIGDIVVGAVPQPHGAIVSAGLTFEHVGRRAVYATDFNALTDEMRAAYQACDLWVVDALRRRPHPTHPDLATVLRWRGEIGARRTVLVHMDWSMDYVPLCAEVPEDVLPAHDGLEIAA
jgi:phosphoribosyl 1,2-cyclic phosphate phosphodiesterase